MVDVLLVQALLKAVPEHGALLILGDIDQLASVDPDKCWLTSSRRARWQ